MYLLKLPVGTSVYPSSKESYLQCCFEAEHASNRGSKSDGSLGSRPDSSTSYAWFRCGSCTSLAFDCARTSYPNCPERWTEHIARKHLRPFSTDKFRLPASDPELGIWGVKLLAPAWLQAGKYVFGCMSANRDWQVWAHCCVGTARRHAPELSDSEDLPAVSGDRRPIPG